MIGKEEILPITRQCQLLDVNRSMFYYKPVPLSQEELELMRQIDGIHMLHTFYGSRKIRDEL